ncbi:MAG TPA: hypothetical protein VHT27_02585 [Solirubrobacteraceae bacterium]|nr:hypothetical protein [Solirubrobacteraceae bacterium]
MSKRPGWLEPYGGDPEWRRQTWSAIVALHARYPRHLEHLQHGWWEDDAQTEQLSALVAWRAEIDNHSLDPRDELAFHGQLEHHRETLRSQGGGVGSTLHPGPPPDGWLPY